MPLFLKNRNRIVRKFEIINPTNVDYDFEWVKENQNDGKRHDQFTCLQSRGRLLSGRKYELGFAFEPDEVGIKETFWRFEIAKYGLSVPFLLVGNATEPKVIFDRAHISFKPLLVGRTAHETVYLINQETKPQRFRFDQNSCYTEGRSAVLLVEPADGELASQSRTPISLSFNAKEQHACVFNLKCHIVGASPHKSLNLNVKGEGFRIETALQCEDAATGAIVELAQHSLSHVSGLGLGLGDEIHMGEVEKNELAFKNLFVRNTGKHRVRFDWLLTSESQEALECFSIEPITDIVEPGDRKHCILKYIAKLEKQTICNLSLKIENGPTYHVRVDGIAVKPDLHISPTTLDFGECFVSKPGMKTKMATLTLINRGGKDLNVSCLTELTAHSAFSYEFKQVILSGAQQQATTSKKPNTTNTTQCFVSFMPHEPIAYEDKLVFELNGLTRREVHLRGHGTLMQIELVDSRNKLFDLGTLQIGKVSKKTLQVINRSRIPVDFNLVFDPKSDQLIKYRQSILSIEPMQNIHLAPNQTVDVNIKFAPKNRMPRFVEDLNIDTNGVIMHLSRLQAACHGYNIRLEANTLPFGAVTQRCATVKRIVMHNDGDIGASFKWDVDKMKPEFSIYPTLGYISPGMEVCFNVTFNPTELANDIRKDGVRCFVEGLEKPLTLNLTGSCIQIVPQKETFSFETYVRSKDSKHITITNRTNSVWQLRPIVDGDYFHGLESLVVDAQSSASYEVVYHPLTMTSSSPPPPVPPASQVSAATDPANKQKHTGSVFFPLPDGTGLMFNLVGVANPPKPVARIQRDVPCKTNHVEVLSVENWLKKPQRFKVSFENIRTDRTTGGIMDQANTTWSLKGNDYLDVPGSGKKDYKLTFHAHKEGLVQTRVVFRNEQTGEYCAYELHVRATRATSSLGTIELFTQVRVPIAHSIRLDNPLGVPATFTATCSNAHEILVPPSVTISARSSGDFNFEYLPLRAGESAAKLEVASAELGVSVYDLKLRAALAPHERALYFRAHLGQTHTLTAKLNNFCRQKTDYVSKGDNMDFRVDKSITAAPSQTPSGIEVSFDITYEPSSIGEFKSTLVLTSSLGGEYVFPLHGTCLPPKPQGPYLVKAGATTSIAFKNVFPHPVTYSFAIDNELFHVTKSTEVIKPHQTYKIIVGFDGNDAATAAAATAIGATTTKADVMAKLVVTAPKSAGTSTHVQWVYYLKGTS